MVTLEELHRQINRSSWFTNLGTFSGPDLFLPVPRIAPYLSRHTDLDLQWFPHDANAPHPIHGDELEQLAMDRGATAEVRMATLTTVKKARISLRSAAPQPLLIVSDAQGAQIDLSDQAKESALYAARRATVELVLGRSGVWAGLIPLYRVGHWPLGRLPDGRLAVY